MSIRSVYNYFFYQLYKFWESASTPKVWSEWKATLTITVLELFLGFSGLFYFTIFRGKSVDAGDDNFIFVFFVIAIVLPNYLLFHRRNQWRDIIEEFDKWPSGKNITGGIVVAAIVIVIFANLFFTFFLMSQVRWQ